MKPRKQPVDVVIRSISNYLNDHFSEPLTLKEIAAQVGYSQPSVRSFYKKETGQSIFSHLLQIRIEKAGRLLAETGLSVTGIAFDVGFQSYTRFEIAFKERTGLTPTQYRRKAKANQEAPISVKAPLEAQKGRERFRDSFTGPGLLPCWESSAGSWQPKDGMLVGEGREAFWLTYQDALPENFSLAFDFRLSPKAHLSMAIHGKNRYDYFMSLAVGRYESGLAEFRYASGRKFWREDVGLAKEAWHTLKLSIIDDNVRIFINDQEIHSCKEPFTPSYSSRCHFTLEPWDGTFSMRSFSIWDHGFLPLVPVVRRADSLYNNRIFDRALDAYMRLLESVEDPGDIPELQYKIGMSFLRQNSFVQARSWFEKVITTGIWSDYAAQAMLEADYLQQDCPALLANASRLYSSPKHVDAVRSVLDQAISAWANAGFYGRTLGVVEMILRVEKTQTHHAIAASLLQGEFLFQLGRHEQARAVLRAMLRQQGLPAAIRVDALIKQADILCSMGDFLEAERIALIIEASPNNPFAVMRAATIRAACLRGQQRFFEAVDFIDRTFPPCFAQGELAAFGFYMKIHLFCMLDRLPEALAIVKNAKESPGGTVLVGDMWAAFEYPVHLLMRRPGDAAGVLLECAKQSSGRGRASLMVRAGILLELASQKDRANEIWLETERRFPADRICFWGDLARYFVSGGEETLAQMPYAAMERTELYYLAGLLFRIRGHNERAKKYFTLSITEDPSLNWFTWMAKKELGMESGAG